MSDFSQFVPEHIRKLAEGNQSRPLKQSGSLVKPIALNLNENPFGPSPLALKAIEAALSDIHRYPEIQACDLHKEIADFHGVEVKQVLVTAGATELLCMIARVLLAPGLNAITSARSFIVYKLATQVTEGRLIEVATRDNGYDLDAIAHAIDANTRIVFIANPNNPTGTLVSAEEVSGFIEKIPDHVLVILDEAYGDFAEYSFHCSHHCAQFFRFRLWPKPRLWPRCAIRNMCGERARTTQCRQRFSVRVSSDCAFTSRRLGRISYIASLAKTLLALLNGCRRQE